MKVRLPLSVLYRALHYDEASRVISYHYLFVCTRCSWRNLLGEGATLWRKRVNKYCNPVNITWWSFSRPSVALSVKSPSMRMHVVLLLHSDVWPSLRRMMHVAEFDSRRLFSRSSVEVEKFLCAHLKSDFKVCVPKHDFMMSQLVRKPIMVQYANYTSVMWKPD